MLECFIEIEEVAIGRQLGSRTEGVAHISQMRVAVEVGRRRAVVGTMDAVHLAHIGVVGLQFVAELVVDGSRIIGLLVLAPADRTHEALVAARDLLPADDDLGVGDAHVLECGNVQIRRDRIKYGRPVGIAVARAVVALVAQRTDVIQFQHQVEILPGSSLEGDA
jgi:hypothetical protein